MNNKMSKNEMIQNYKKMKTASILNHTIRIQKPSHEVYQFFVNHFKDNYQKMAKGHIKFEMINKETLQEGAVIHCEEWAGNQTAFHQYQVTDMIENSLISYSSKPSKIKVKVPFKTIDSESNTYVSFFFDSFDEGTELTLYIVIEFHSRFEKYFSILMRGLIPWKNHLIEEMTGLKKLFRTGNG